MLRIVSLAIVLLSGTVFAAEPPSPADVLNRFVGQWTTTGEGVMAPGKPPIKCTGTANARKMGSWLISNNTGKMLDIKVQALLTLGYDDDTKKYVGTWVDSMMPTMWHYTGTLDATGKVLTLEADGPSMTDPKVKAKYQDIYEFKSADHIVLMSKLRSPDGKWVEFMKADYQRIVEKK
jgi:hypothetical protein